VGKADEAVGYKLEALAAQAGVSARTVRYYVQRGLLPPPVFRGRDTLYGAEHLTRLGLIRRLQRLYLPLDRIAGVLSQGDLEGVRALAEASDTELLGRVTESDPEPDSDGGEDSPTPRPAEGTAGRWTRWCLAPGVELWVDDAADADARSLAARLRAEAARGTKNQGEKA
jgi:Ca-activated chloride channel family protein